MIDQPAAIEEEMILIRWEESSETDKCIQLGFHPMHAKLMREFKRKRIKMVMANEDGSAVGDGVFEVWGISTGEHWIKIRVESLEPFKGRQEQVFGVRLEVLEDDEHVQPQTKKDHPYSDFATHLFKNWFFNIPKVRYHLDAEPEDTPEQVKELLKAQINGSQKNQYESLADIPPELIKRWADNRGIVFTFLQTI